MKSLIIEDEFTSYMHLKHFLLDYGEVDVASNGEKALEIISSKLSGSIFYDLICIDVKLPDMSGHEILKEIRKIEDDIKLCKKTVVFIITSLNTHQDMIDAFVNKCDEFINKPVKKEDLKNKLLKYKLI